MKRDYNDGGVTGTYIFYGEEGWNIMKTDHFSKVVTIHYCKDDPKRRPQWKYQGRRPCHFCKKTAPNEIQAIITLYNGDV